ncbi:hypothetical protein AcW2_006383 [Taiwanofungus camphoratus]|nr:hypothetical protein AcW2_006383 [Antrodia cinnamomea]
MKYYAADSREPCCLEVTHHFTAFCFDIPNLTMGVEFMNGQGLTRTADVPMAPGGRTRHQIGDYAKAIVRYPEPAEVETECRLRIAYIKWARVDSSAPYKARFTSVD